MEYIDVFFCFGIFRYSKIVINCTRINSKNKIIYYRDQTLLMMANAKLTVKLQETAAVIQKRANPYIIYFISTEMALSVFGISSKLFDSKRHTYTEKNASVINTSRPNGIPLCINKFFSRHFAFTVLPSKYK